MKVETGHTRSHLGQMLVLYRAANNIGVRDLAPEIGTSAATLSRIERGYLPDVETFMKIQHWLLAGRR